MKQLDDYTKKAITRLVKKITVDGNGCHIYNGAVNSSSGHKRFLYKGNYMMVHRFVMEVIKETPLRSHIYEVVRHKCDNPACVNPNHLEVGSRVDNMRDWIERRHQKKQGSNYQ